MTPPLPASRDFCGAPIRFPSTDDKPDEQGFFIGFAAVPLYGLLAAAIRVYGGMLSAQIGGERAVLLAFSLVLAGALLLPLS